MLYAKKEEKMMKNNKVLVTGGFGYIGGELIKELQRQDIDYLSVDKLNQPSPKNLSFNLCERERTIKVIRDFQPDLLIHCGTHSAIAYRDNFFESFKEDFQALVNILEALLTIPNCRLIYFSTSYVYSGLPPTIEVNENQPLLPEHNFGIGKSFFEKFILRNHINSIVFRLSSLFGPGNYLHPNTIFNLAKECFETNKVTIWGFGKRMIQYVFMKDVINYIFEAFYISPGIYNLVGDEYISVANVAKTIASFFGGKVVFIKDKPEGETLPFIINNKLKTASNKNLFTPFSTALTEYFNSIK